MLKLAMGLVFSLVASDYDCEMGTSPQPPQITISPIPPVQGQTATITYTGPLPASVTVSFKPTTIADMHLSIGISGSIEITIPDNAESMKATDDAGIAEGDATLIDTP